MCTGLELLVGALGAASVASTLFTQQPSVPKVETPATAAAADAARDAGATVRVGVRDETEEGEDQEADTTFVEQRKQAQTLTGLGRGGLAI